jgi:hypothetical protein
VEARDVSAWMRQVRNEPAPDRIGRLRKDYGYRLGRLHQRRRCWIRVSENHIRRKSGQLRSGGAGTFGISIRESIFNLYVAAFGPTEFLEALPERREESLRFGIGLAEWDQHADSPHALAPLRARCERPTSATPEAQDRASYRGRRAD